MEIFVEAGNIFIKTHSLAEGAVFKRINYMEQEPFVFFLLLPGPDGKVVWIRAESADIIYARFLRRIFGEPLAVYNTRDYAHYLVEYERSKYLISYDNHELISAVHLIPDTHVVGQKKYVLFSEFGKVKSIICGDYTVQELEGCITL